LINPIYEVDTVSATAKCPKIEPTFIANTVWKQANQGLGIPERPERYEESNLRSAFTLARLPGYAPAKRGGMTHLFDQVIHEYPDLRRRKPR
jgi:hypothetical protein